MFTECSAVGIRLMCDPCGSRRRHTPPAFIALTSTRPRHSEHRRSKTDRTFDRICSPAGETVDDSRFAPLYSVAMIIWAVLFNKFWIRREARLSVEWGTIWSSAAVDVRPDFKGAPPQCNPSRPISVASAAACPPCVPTPARKPAGYRQVEEVTRDGPAGDVLPAVAALAALRPLCRHHRCAAPVRVRRDDLQPQPAGATQPHPPPSLRNSLSALRGKFVTAPLPCCPPPSHQPILLK